RRSRGDARPLQRGRRLRALARVTFRDLLPVREAGRSELHRSFRGHGPLPTPRGHERAIGDPGSGSICLVENVRAPYTPAPPASNLEIFTPALSGGGTEMRCEEIMKRDIECVSPKTSASEAARRMRDQNVGFLPVCQPEKKVVGTVTDRDIAVRLV